MRETEMSTNIIRLTAAAKLALAQEIARMVGHDEGTDAFNKRVARGLLIKSAHLLDEFHEVQREWLSVPMWDWFGQNRPLWKIDPQEAWDRDGAYTEAIANSNRARA
jgi:hypothetical protein